ncbi:MAG: hypothetical protein Q8N47_20840, partial [Bryobacterales bacterium]|nr:hypothetical protein [Bryobacterales bacterium]
MDWLAAEPGDFFYMIKQLAAVLVHEKIHAMEQEHSPILESLSRSRLMWLAALGNEIHEWHPYVVELRFLRNIHFWLGRVRPKNWQDKQAEVRQEIIDAFDELGRAGGPSEELKKQMEDEGIRFALAPGAGAAVATVRAGQGLNTVVFRTASGDKLVHVTDDLASGDTFSGTVEDVLAGKTEQERAASQDELSGLVVEVAGESVPQRTKWFKRTAPAVAVLPVLLRNRQGRVVATA